MADVFATVDDLKARWPEFPSGGEKHAEVLLEDATQFILDEVPNAINASENTRRRVVCAVVRRAMQAGAADLAGFEQYAETAGPFAESFRVSNPSGDFYLTKAERRALGGGSQVAFSTSATGAQCSEHGQACARNFGALYCDCGLEVFGEVRHA